MQPAPILLAEDDEDDILFIQRAYTKAHLPNELIVTNDGYQVVDYLQGQPPYTDRKRYPLPALVLLDIKMRLMDGFEVLAWLQTHRHLNGLPAVVLTSSTVAADMKRARELGARDYLVKPSDPQKLVPMLQGLKKWIAAKTPAAPEKG